MHIPVGRHRCQRAHGETHEQQSVSGARSRRSDHSVSPRECYFRPPARSAAAKEDKSRAPAPSTRGYQRLCLEREGRERQRGLQRSGQGSARRTWLRSVHCRTVGTHACLHVLWPMASTWRARARAQWAVVTVVTRGHRGALGLLERWGAWCDASQTDKSSGWSAPFGGVHGFARNRRDVPHQSGCG